MALAEWCRDVRGRFVLAPDYDDPRDVRWLKGEPVATSAAAGLHGASDGALLATSAPSGKTSQDLQPMVLIALGVQHFLAVIGSVLAGVTSRGRWTVIQTPHSVMFCTESLIYLSEAASE
jgi:hypothetical protein